MNHPKSKDILIYHSENMFVEHVDNRIEGEFNRVHWHDLNKINDAIISLISNVSGKAESVPYISVDSENRSHTNNGQKATYIFKTVFIIT